MASVTSQAAAQDLVAEVLQTPAAHALRRRVEQGGALSCPNIAAPAGPFYAALLHRLFSHRPIVAITRDLKAQEAFLHDLQTWLELVTEDRSPRSKVQSPKSPAVPPPLFYPAWEALPHEGKLPHADVISERLETLVALTRLAATHPPRPAATVVVASLPALLQRTFPPEELRRRRRTLRRDDVLDPLDLVEWLEDQAYEPEAQVTQKAELALRGGIVDVFPLTSPWPVRLEFFGNTLESLRFFDPQSQVSREEIAEITLPPAGELGLLRRLVEAPASGAASPTASDSPLAPRPDRLSTLCDYLPSETIFLLCEPLDLAEHARRYAEQVPAHDPFFIAWDQLQAELAARGFTRLELTEAAFHPARVLRTPPGSTGDSPVPNGDPPLGTGEAPESPHAAGTGDAEPLPATLERPVDSAPPPLRADLTFTSLDAFRPLGEHAPELPVAEAQRRQFFAQLHRWLRQGRAVHVFCNNDGERDRFLEIWAASGFEPSGSTSDAPSPASNGRRPKSTGPADGKAPPPPASDAPLRASDLRLRTHLGSLSRGFLCEAAQLVVVTDAEIFGRYKLQRPRRLKSPHAAAVRSALDIDFTDLAEGDYVVHLQHGIGRYCGLQRLPASRGRKGAVTDTPEPSPTALGEECLVLEYAPTDPELPSPKLYVPVTEAHMVSKYVGAGKARPPLNTLGGGRWAKAKAQATEAVRDLAAELLRLQASRAAQPGFAFPADAPWQREFESAFIFEETPDQIRAILETKRDLEAPKPMDRLICGDVGFGKTEVAIRAAFKTVLAGKQVALLVPTTVLAQQHFNTFRERMADYPVRVELLSRFRTRRQQDAVLEGLAAGAVDIVVGTHRLVQPDVVFKDLGLVVIDEEQRFGVLHKERLKQLRQLVDVLTLSATPIPRTLYLALTGARDMSTIETPPLDRLPVETIIAAYDERLIRDAIQRELNRGGQVFYLHNRIFDIDAVALKLQVLVPQARLAVGHGQMHADDLEAVMGRFVNGEVDVLLSTTIIESGIDIPNANTIIIDRADRFGLSDLYQLRGRVGRYKHQAFAYLLIPRHAGLLADARKRITAVKQFSSPGSGFKIAMRDLEIRGAGNLLGPEQSGHIAAVGFELYCQLLKQSVAALQGKPVPPRVEVLVRLDFIDLTPVGEAGPETKGQSSKAEGRRRPPPLNIAVPRDVATYVTEPAAAALEESVGETAIARLPHASACLPLRYVPEPQHRLEMYRKLAQATDKPALESVRRELRDRFGPLPSAVDLLLEVAALKLLAASRGIRAVETRGDKLMLSRGGDFLQVGGKFPRLTKRTPRSRLNEIRKLLLAL